MRKMRTFFGAVLLFLSSGAAAAAQDRMTWSAGAPMPSARSEIAIAALDGRVYVVGSFTGERELDASAIADYFAPLSRWLTEQNKGETCGW